MRELSFAEVRAAGLRAYVEFAYVGYEYRPLYDDVAIHIPPACESCGATLRVPQAGWLHPERCPCPYCHTNLEEVPDERPGHLAIWQEASREAVS
jgi:hypothetical protein